MQFCWWIWVHENGGSMRAGQADICTEKLNMTLQGLKHRLLATVPDLHHPPQYCFAWFLLAPHNPQAGLGSWCQAGCFWQSGGKRSPRLGMVCAEVRHCLQPSHLLAQMQHSTHPIQWVIQPDEKREESQSSSFSRGHPCPWQKTYITLQWQVHETLSSVSGFLGIISNPFSLQ